MQSLVLSLKTQWPPSLLICVLNDTGQLSVPSPLGDPLQNMLHCFQLLSQEDLVGSRENVTTATKQKKQQLRCTLSLFDTSVLQQ